jgi:hypothetical protein
MSPVKTFLFVNEWEPENYKNESWVKITEPLFQIDPGGSHKVIRTLNHF